MEDKKANNLGSDYGISGGIELCDGNESPISTMANFWDEYTVQALDGLLNTFEEKSDNADFHSYNGTTNSEATPDDFSSFANFVVSADARNEDVVHPTVKNISSDDKADYNTGVFSAVIDFTCTVYESYIANGIAAVFEFFSGNKASNNIVNHLEDMGINDNTIGAVQGVGNMGDSLGGYYGADSGALSGGISVLSNGTEGNAMLLNGSGDGAGGYSEG